MRKYFKIKTFCVSLCSKIYNMKLTLTGLIIILLSFSLSAQQFKYEATLQKPDSSGFYYIYLPPQITSKLNRKFSDIRIYDSQNHQIPYIRLNDEDLYKTAKKIRLRIIQNEHKKQKRFTYVLLHNPKHLSINNLSLIIENKKGEIWVNVAGSDDAKNWNILKTNTRYQAELSDSSLTELRITDLPATAFEYYRVIIYDFNGNIFNVHGAFTYDIRPRKREFVEVEHPSFQQDDSSEIGYTILKITFHEPQYVDKFKFIIESPQFYLRKAELIKKDTATGQKIHLKFYDQTQKDFYLCSDSTNELLLSRYYVKNVYLIVHNNDDIPLKFKDVRAYQQKEYLIAFLKKGGKYVLKFGNPNLPSPIYDLKFFRNKIPSKCPIITIKKIKNLIKEKKQKKSIYVSPTYLWIALAVVVFILIIVSFFIFKNSNNNEQNNAS